MIAPLIKPIRLQGGTFYTFSSASEDLGLTFNNSQKKFRFSKFALLNIPDMKNPQVGENYINPSNTPGGFADIDGSKTENDYFAESFQNYCLNLEAIVTSDPAYDPNLLRSVSERVFFKWLKETGAIRFRPATQGTEYRGGGGQRWVEEDESESYQRVVKYIGDINILNNVRNNFNAFSEIYIYIPTSHGNTPVVLFDTKPDQNYGPNKTFTNAPVNPLAAEYLYGRSASTAHPAGLSTFAFYDSDTETFTVDDPFGATSNFYRYDPATDTYLEVGTEAEWWFGAPDRNTYYLEPDTFSDSTNDRFKIESVNKSVEFTRSRLDGISLEVSPERYSGINNAATGLVDFGKYNESSDASNFDFNAILVYYDLYDPANPTNPATSRTNLFGVLFLDNVDPLPAGGGYIPRLTKYKPNPLTGDNGNSYAFRINLKFDVNTQDAPIETSINDYNPVSLELYMEALNEMMESVRILEENNMMVKDLESQVALLNNYILSDSSAEEIKAKLDELEISLASNSAVFTNTENILNLIQRNYQEITNIYKGLTTVEMAYNLDILVPGQGIFLDKRQNGTINIVNTNQMFNIGTNVMPILPTDFADNSTDWLYNVKLIDFTNYLKIDGGSIGSPYNADKDVVIQVDDSAKTWQKGQVFRMSFKNGLDLNNSNGKFNFIVYSDATDRLNTGSPYSAEIAFLTYIDFENKGNSPIIEIVCIDPATYTFTVDIF